MISSSNSKDITSFVNNCLSSLSQSDIVFYTNIVTKLQHSNYTFSNNELYELFDSIDKYDRGSIEFSQIIAFLCVFRSEVNSFYIDKILTELSKEKVEKISRDGFVELMKLGMKKYDKNDHSELEDIFGILDTDHDGVINYDDIQIIMNSLGEVMFDENMSKKMASLLSDDGCVTKQMFVGLFKNEKF